MSKLGNLLNFKEYSSKDEFLLKPKQTKRTESSLDVILENKMNDMEKREFIAYYLEKLDDETIDQIYHLMIENGIEDEDEIWENDDDTEDGEDLNGPDDDLDPTGSDYDDTPRDLEVIEDDEQFSNPTEDDFEEDRVIKKFEE